MINYRKVVFHPAVLIPLLLIFFILSIAFAKVIVWPRVKLYQGSHYKNSAKEHLDVGNYRDAFIEIRKAILKNPNDTESYHIALEAAENSDDHFQYVPGFLTRLMELESENADHFTKFILIALQIGMIEEAQSAFEKFPVEVENQAEYHQLGYSIGIGIQEIDMADYHLSKLAEINPDDMRLRQSLSALRLRTSDDESLRSEAEQALKELADTESGRTAALRTLLAHSLVEQDPEKTKEYISELSKQEDILVRDRLLILQAKKLVDIDTFTSSLATFLKREINDPIDISLVLDFFLKNEMAREASDWLETLDSEQTNHEEVGRKASQIYYITKEWEKLKTTILEEDWQDTEFGRLLLLAFTSKQEDDEISFNKYWQQCLIQIGSDTELLKLLFNTASSWGWTEESIDVMERYFHEAPADTEIFQVIVSHFMATGETDRAIEALERRVDYVPDDLGSKNNFALLSLLTDKNKSRAFSFARDNFNANNEDPFFTTTWAFALQAQGRAQEAVNLIEFLSEEEKGDPQRAVYLAAIYLQAGKQDTAERYLAKVDESTLFPEEGFLYRTLKRTISEAVK